MMSLPIWLPGPMFLLGSGLCASSPVPSREVSLQGSLSGGCLCLGVVSVWGCLFLGVVSVWGVSVQEDFCEGDPLYGEERA